MSFVGENYTGPLDTFYNNEGRDMAQYITIGENGPNRDVEIKAVDLYIYATNPDDIEQVYVMITGTKPRWGGGVEPDFSNIKLQSNYINGSDISISPHWYRFKFDGTDTFTLGTMYAIVLSTTNGNTSHHINWGVSPHITSVPSHHNYGDTTRGYLALRNESWIGSNWDLEFAKDFLFKVINAFPGGHCYLYYPPLTSTSFIKCWCTEWKVKDYGINCSFITDADSAAVFRSSIYPGATKELYKLLGRPFYVDTTWEGNNTIIISPISGSGLSKVRDEKVVYVKSYKDEDINQWWKKIQMAVYLSGNQPI